MKRFWFVSISIFTIGFLICARPSMAQYGFGFAGPFGFGGFRFGGLPTVSTFGSSPLYRYNPYNSYFNPYGRYGITYMPTAEGYVAVPYPLPQQPMGGYPLSSQNYGPNVPLPRASMTGQTPVSNPSGGPASKDTAKETPNQIGDSISAHYNSDSKLVVKWDGDTRDVTSITFALLDDKRNVLMQKTIEQRKAEVQFTVTNVTAYYEVIVKYANGFQTKVISPI